MMWPMDLVGAGSPTKRLMRTGDLLLAALTLILALEGKVWTVAMLERQLDGCARDHLDSAVAQSAVSA